jgi:hypothetical protein
MNDERKPNPRRDEARANVAKWIDDPKFKREKGHPDDEATRDGSLDVPADLTPPADE